MTSKRDPNDMSDAEITGLISAASPPIITDPDAELSFLAAASIVPAHLDACKLEPSDFADPARRSLFQAMVFARETAGPPPSVGSLARGRGSDPRTARIARDRVMAASVRRLAASALGTVQSTQTFDPCVLRRVSESLVALGARMEDAGGERLRAYRDVVRDVGSDAISLPLLAMTGEPTGLPIDGVTGGLKRGEYWIVAGSTQQGKSWFANLMALGWARGVQGASDSPKALIVSTEMGERAMAARSLSTLAGVSLDRLLRHDLSGGARERVEQAMSSFPPNVLLASMGGSSIDRVIRAAKSVEGLGLLVVDLASGLRGRNAAASGFDRLTEISNSLQGLAKDADIQVVGVVQLKKSWYEDRPGPGREGVLGAIKGTGAFYEDPDMVISITSGEGAGETILGVEKNRRTGRLGRVSVFRGESGEMMVRSGGLRDDAEKD